MLKDILSLLALVQEEIVVSLLHWDIEEVEGGDLLHGELLLEGCSGTLEKLQAQDSESDCNRTTSRRGLLTRISLSDSQRSQHIRTIPYIEIQVVVIAT
jgi:hypothetical protein